jgi:hypothetical protein
MRLFSLIVFTTLLNLFAGQAHAALLVVDPTGMTGTYVDLQAALDASQDGDVIHVKGGTYESIVISTAVTIVGGPAPAINPTNFWGAPDQPPAITLLGSGSGKVVLANIVTGGVSDGGFFSTSGAAIAGGGFSSLVIADSTIAAPDWILLTGLAAGRPAISTTVPNIIIERSTVTGQASETDDCYGVAINGPAGISAPSSKVVLLDSTVTGGNGSELCSYFAAPTTNACPCAGEGGVGGNGVHAQSFYIANSAVNPGHGLPAYYLDTNFNVVPWGVQPDGTAIVASSTYTWPNTLSASGAFQLGTNWSLTLGTLAQSDILLATIGSVSPYILGGIPSILNLSALFVNTPLPSGITSLPYSIPNNFPVGIEITLQVYDSANSLLARPVVLVTIP